jgi:transcriptional regulator with XRE-family HTH domain
MSTIGSIIKDQRKARGLSQQELAQGICAQSMISAIENDRHVPNALLTVALCQRLEITLTTLSLAENYAISENKQINARLNQLCTQHQYADLLKLLQDSNTVTQIGNQLQQTSFDYYMGVAHFQLNQKGNFADADRYFTLTTATAKVQGTVALVLLAQAGRGLIAAMRGFARQSHAIFQETLAALDKVTYEPNLNSIHYLAGLAAVKLGQLTQASGYLLSGIKFATQHNSHEMLANHYYLLALIAKESGQPDVQDKTHARFLAELFDERLYDPAQLSVF